jgi:hypothetical protein
LLNGAPFFFNALHLQHCAIHGLTPVSHGNFPFTFIPCPMPAA